ncbi:MAG: hypothetical protein PHT07_22270 [Paludibacter sp.]|nr:hypothetical protein [Paludibacter sp.]
MGINRLEKFINFKNEFNLELFKLLIDSDINLISKKINLSIADITYILKKNIGFDMFVLNHFKIFKLEVLFRFYNICNLEFEDKSNEFIDSFNNYLKSLELKLDFHQFQTLYKLHLRSNFGNENLNWYRGKFVSSPGTRSEELSDIYLYKNEKNLYEFSFPPNFNTNEIILQIDKYVNNIDWDKLTGNRSLKWDILLIDKFKEKINWEILSGRDDLDWNENLLFKFKENLVWGKFSRFEGISHKKKSIDDIFDFETTDYEVNNKYFSFDYLNCISYNKGINWTVDLIIKFENKIDFFLLARNGKLDFKTIKYFERKWSQNEVIFMKTIKTSSDTWDENSYCSTGWENLSINPNIILTSELYHFLEGVNIEIEEYSKEKKINFLSKIKANKLFTNLKIDDNFIIEIINEPFLYHNVFYDWEKSNQSIIDLVYKLTIAKNGFKQYGIDDPEFILSKSLNFFSVFLWSEYHKKLRVSIPLSND